MVCLPNGMVYCSVAIKYAVLPLARTYFCSPKIRYYSIQLSKKKHRITPSKNSCPSQYYLVTASVNEAIQNLNYALPLICWLAGIPSSRLQFADNFFCSSLLLAPWLPSRKLPWWRLSQDMCWKLKIALNYNFEYFQKGQTRRSVLVLAF